MGHPLPPRRPGSIQPYTPAVATVERCPFAICPYHPWPWRCSRRRQPEACPAALPGLSIDPARGAIPPDSRRPTTSAVLRLRASGPADWRRLAHALGLGPTLTHVGPRLRLSFDSGPPAQLTRTHACPRLRLSFDSGPPARLPGTGLHTPWAWDQLGPTSAHDCGCSSTPGLRPSRPELTPAHGCGCFSPTPGPPARLASDSRRPTTAAAL